MEGVRQRSAERANRRPRLEQYQPHAAAWSRPRRAENPDVQISRFRFFMEELRSRLCTGGRSYIRDTLELIASATGTRSTGWSSPSVYANADTMQAMAAAGITYTLDGMDSDIVSRLNTPDGPLVL
jgi:hypothetical protein